MMVELASQKTGNIFNIYLKVISLLSINQFPVLCSVAWPLNENEAGGDLALIETSLLFFYVNSYH